MRMCACTSLLCPVAALCPSMAKAEWVHVSGQRAMHLAQPGSSVHVHVQAAQPAAARGPGAELRFQAGGATSSGPAAGLGYEIILQAFNWESHRDKWYQVGPLCRPCAWEVLQMPWGYQGDTQGALLGTVQDHILATQRMKLSHLEVVYHGARLL